MNTASNNDPLDQSLAALRRRVPKPVENELSSLARKIKEHEAIAFHQLREIGEKLNLVAKLLQIDCKAIDKWMQDQLAYTKTHAYRLRRFADRMQDSPDQRVVGMFETSGSTSLWLLFHGSDSVVSEVEQLAKQQGTRATREQVERIRTKYKAGEKAAKAELEMVNLLIENSFDQDLEVCDLKSKVEQLTKQLSSQQV